MDWISISKNLSPCLIQDVLYTHPADSIFTRHIYRRALSLGAFVTTSDQPIIPSHLLVICPGHQNVFSLPHPFFSDYSPEALPVLLHEKCGKSPFRHCDLAISVIAGQSKLPILLRQPLNSVCSDDYRARPIKPVLHDKTIWYIPESHHPII